MPAIVTAPFLLAVIIVGSAAAFGLLLLTAAVRMARHLIAARRARQDGRARPLLLRAIAVGGLSPELVGAGGARGRAVERVAFTYLARLRGESHDLIAELLERRGAVAQIIRRSAWPWRNQRALEASRLGLVASAAAERRLERMALGDRSQRVRVVAARGLGKTGTARAAQTLLSLLGPRPVAPEGVVASALLELGPEAAPALRRSVAAEPAGAPAPTADGSRRSMAADVLGLLDEMPAWPALVACADDPDLKVRVSAVRALGHLGVPQAAAAVSRRLAPDEDGEVRAEAARALGRIGDPRSVAALASSLDDPDYQVAHNTAFALAALGDPGWRALERAVAADAPGAAHAREALALRARAAPA